jgi:heat shock protein HslJ
MSINRASVVAALVASSVLTACGSDDASSELEGRWDGPGRATISLKEDGTAQGNDGCNDVAAAWKATSDTAGDFTITESSEMACPGVTGWGEAAAYFVSDDTLTIEDSEGEDLTELVRAD